MNVFPFILLSLAHPRHEYLYEITVRFANILSFASECLRESKGSFNNGESVRAGKYN